MKFLYYFFRYSIFLLLGNFIKYLGIPSLYELPYLILIPFNYLAINYGIKHPLEKRKDIEYKKIKLPLIIMCVILNTIIILIFKPNFVSWLILVVSTIIILFLNTPKHEKIKDETQKYIGEYFNNNKNTSK